MEEQAKEISSKTTPQRRRERKNVGMADRVISGVIGAGSIAFGIWQATRNPWRLAFAVLGPPLLARAALGRCALYRALGIDTAHGGRRDQAEPSS